jgi:acetyl esterase/lipase
MRALWLCLLPVPLLAQKPIGPRDIDTMPSRTPTARIAYGTDSLQFGDLRIPEGSGPFPVAIIIHGGCWLSRFATLTIMSPLADALARDGIATWNIEYRRNDHPGGGWPGSFLDVANGVDHVRALARKYPLDTTRVAITGHSAGAHLALWAAARHRVRPASAIAIGTPFKPAVTVPLGGPGDVAEITGREKLICGATPSASGIMGGMPGDAPDHYRDGSPLSLLPFGVKQVLIVGENDRVMPKEVREAWIARAREAGDDATLVIVPGGHFEILAPDHESGRTVRRTIVERLHMK